MSRRIHKQTNTHTDQGAYIAFFRGKWRDSFEISGMMEMKQDRVTTLIKRADGDAKKLEKLIEADKNPKPARSIRIFINPDEEVEFSTNQAAKYLGISAQTLGQRIAKYGLDSYMTWYFGPMPKDLMDKKYRKGTDVEMDKLDPENVTIGSSFKLISSIIEEAKEDVKAGDRQAARFLLNNGGLLFWYLETIPRQLTVGDDIVEFDVCAAMSRLAAFVYRYFPDLKGTASPPRFCRLTTPLADVRRSDIEDCSESAPTGTPTDVYADPVFFHLTPSVPA